MEELNKYAVTTYLVEELEIRVLRAFDTEFEDFYWQAFTGLFDPSALDNKMQSSMLDSFIKYIYVRSKPLNNHEINTWLTISANQFKTHSPDNRKEFLRETYFQFRLSGAHKTREPNELDNDINKFFEIIFDSYKRNFYLFEQATDQAKSEFKQGYFGGPQSISSPNTSDKPKLKTNFTVPELAYLFKALSDEGYIVSKTNSEIYNFISDNFSSKKQDEVSYNSIKNHFENPDIGTINSWQVIFGALGLKAKKDKEK